MSKLNSDRYWCNYFITKMSSAFKNGFKTYPTTPAFVLSDETSEEVGRGMIVYGLQKQPFIIFDMDKAFRRIQHFKEVMPRVRIFYAMKSNDNDMMLKLGISQGIGFDCASPGEIYKLRKLNVCPTSIIYAMTTKTAEQMAYARKSGVRHTTFDTSYELQKCADNWPDARLLIRIRVDSVCQVPLGDKFGCDFDTEAIPLLDEAAGLGLKVVGVAFHVGSNCSSLESYVTGLKYTRALFDHEARAGRNMKIVDIGGGFLSETDGSIDQVAKLINNALEELFPDPKIQVIAEPGRFLCDSAFTMYCSINNIRRPIKDGQQTNMIYINDGIYGCLSRLEEWNTPIKFKSTEHTGDLEEVSVWGPSCDSADRIMKNSRILLPRCTALDWLVFRGIGAYSVTFSTRFSSLEIPLIRTVISSELWNKIKDKDIFAANDFELNPDISTPLPVTTPPLLPKDIVYKHSQTPTLKL